MHVPNTITLKVMKTTGTQSIFATFPWRLMGTCYGEVRRFQTLYWP